MSVSMHCAPTDQVTTQRLREGELTSSCPPEQNSSETRLPLWQTLPPNPSTQQAAKSQHPARSYATPHHDTGSAASHRPQSRAPRPRPRAPSRPTGAAESDTARCCSVMTARATSRCSPEHRVGHVGNECARAVAVVPGVRPGHLGRRPDVVLPSISVWWRGPG